MDDADKKRLEELNQRAEDGADYILGKVAALPHTWIVLVVFGAICFILGWWAH